MRILVQRVKQSSCRVNYEIISEINNGFLLFTAFTHTDTIEDVKYLAKKVANLRVFEDEYNKMSKSIKDMNYEILNISQFTLYGDTKKGNRPSFTKAMVPTKAKELYLELTSILNNEYNIKTKNGEFGAYMDIKLINDGPVTVMLESKEK
ncbi:D-tyrosyl-tRNA(Tyr) deacylase [Candidatus Izimaplasma bacterium HR1]|jgi:D-tyrosyl-tRNA(Tyr) deacylase|uniref:D-aminoacyl-tRNA deacylase n=1 Tax=Candidatus Izimoplasma sp. HR1 TaxID=1541959 RepID=UPI0004F7AC6B|nr:D-tyrosyl-tRNA(Tyr) deacylase [Candidatus Izimaplasma bacterium HR1]